MKRRFFTAQFAEECLKTVFVFSLFLYVALFIVDDIVTGFVSRVFDMNSILWVMGISLFFLLPFLPQEEETGVDKKTPQKKTMFLLGLVGAILTVLKTRSMGVSGYLLAMFAGVVIVLILMSLLDHPADQEDR